MNVSGGRNTLSTPRALSASSCLYLVAHVWLLFLGDTVFWDDWVLITLPSHSIIDMYGQQGAPWVGIMHNFLLEFFPGIDVYRILTLLTHLGTGVLLFYILATIGQLDSKDRFLLVSLFLVAPFFWSRVTLITITYSLALFLFHLAWCLFARQMRPNPRIFPLVSAGFVFFVSFFLMPSLLVYFAVPCAHFVWQIRAHLPNIFNKRFALFFPVCAMPVAAWAIKTTLFESHGVYTNYNTFRPEAGYWYNVLDDMVYLFLHLDVPLSMVLAMMCLTWALMGIWSQRETPKSRYSGISGFADDAIKAGSWVIVGSVVSYLAVFPYLIVGKIPDYTDWVSRHQALMPLGTALLAWSPKFLLNTHQQRIWFSGILAIFIAVDMGYYIDVARDSIKQDAVLRAFSVNNRIISNSTFPIDDRTMSYNVESRNYRAYEWIGMLDHAIVGKTSRYADSIRGSTLEEWIARRDDEVESLQALGMLDQYDFSDPDCIVTIEKGDYDLQPVSAVMRVRIMRSFEPPEYEALLQRVLNIQCRDLSSYQWNS